MRVRESSWERINASVLREQVGSWLGNSLLLVSTVTLACLVLGVLTAWLLACTTVRTPGWWTIVAVLPLAVPSYVAALGWVIAGSGVQGFWPAWLILTAVSTPYVTLTTLAALRRADQALIDVARTAGYSPIHALRVGLLPQIMPAAAAGGLLAALYTISDFGAVAMLRYPVFTFAIHRQYGSFLGRDIAAVMALILVVVILVIIWSERSARGRGQRWQTSSGVQRPLVRVRLPWWCAIPAWSLAAIPVVVGLLVPVGTLVQRLFNLGSRWPLDWSRLLDASLSTLGVSVAGGVLALALALPVGVLAARYRGRLTSTIESVGYTGLGLPGIVVGLALVFAANRFLPSLYQTTALLAFAYAVMFMPKAIGAVRTSVETVPPLLPQVARTLGRSPLRASGVTLRLATPGVTAGLLLVIVTVMKELPATLMLHPTGMETLAMMIWSRTQLGAHAAAAPYAVAIIVLASIPTILLTRRSAWEDGR